MAKIKKTDVYDLTAPALNDYVPGTDVSDFNRTKSFPMSGIVELVVNEIENGQITERIISGEVEWETGMTYVSTPIYYYLDGEYRTAEAQSVTLPNADSTYDRIDVIAVNTDEELVYVQGTASLNPLEPQVTYGEQLKVTFVYIKAGATTPVGVAEHIIYDENEGQPNEWDANASSANISLNSPDQPYSGSVSISGDAATIGDEFVLTNDNLTNPLEYQHFSLRIYLRYTAPVMAIVVKLSVTGGDDIGYFVVTNGNYGFDSSLLEEYQNIMVPVSEIQFFTSSYSFNKINAVVGGATNAIARASWYIDQIRLVNNSVNLTPQTYLALTDTNNSYEDKKGGVPMVNDSESALEFEPLFLFIEGNSFLYRPIIKNDTNTLQNGDLAIMGWISESQFGKTLIFKGTNGTDLNDSTFADWTVIESI